jgi:hypothetical protein
MKKPPPEGDGCCCAVCIRRLPECGLSRSVWHLATACCVATFELVPTVGFEPTASGLQNHCSTVELYRRIWRCGRICTSRQPVGHSVACYLHPLMPPCAFQHTSGGVFRFGLPPSQSFGLLRWRWPCHAANVAVVSLAHGLRL